MPGDFDMQIALDRLAEALLPDEEMAQHKANTAVVSKDGGVHSRALAASLPWYRAGVFIPGAATAASDVARMPFAQGGTIRHVSIHARTAPSGTYIIRLTSGAESERFSLQGGVTTTMRGASLRVEPGSWVIVDILNDGGAADVEITTLYAVSPGGSTSGGTGGGGGGGAASWGSIGGTLAHQSDLWTALAGKADDDHNHDGVYSPATHSHAYSELTDRPTLGTAAAMDANSFATAAQGAQAESAVQPGDLADVATSGDYSDLDNTPTIPAQFNPIEGANVTITGTYPDLTFSSSGGGGGGGDMSTSTYDPTNQSADAFDMDNMAEGANTKILTAAERSSIASATQPGDLATVATSGEYDDLTGAPTIPVTLSTSENGDPTDTTVVESSANNYANFTTIFGDTLSGYIPAITSGTWDVDVIATITVDRSVATGGVWLAIGDTTTRAVSILSRNFPQDTTTGLTIMHSYTDRPASTPIHVRYAGWSTAGTTNIRASSIQIVARKRS